jgi:hypothetical protein
MDTQPGSPQEPSPERRCEACGAPLEGSARYCPSCGRPASVPAPDVDIAGWFRSGWNVFVNNIGIAIGLPLLIVVPVVAVFLFAYVGSIPLAITADSHHGPSVLALVIVGSVFGFLLLILALVMPALTAGTYACFLQGIRTGKVTAAGLKAGFRNWWACTWVVWVMQLATLVCLPFVLLFLVGFLGILVVQMLSWLALLHIVDKERGGIEALSFAWNAMRGRFWMLIVFTLVVQIVMNAGVAAVYLGLLATAPIGMAAFAAAYDALSKKVEPPEAAP